MGGDPDPPPYAGVHRGGNLPVRLVLMHTKEKTMSLRPTPKRTSAGSLSFRHTLVFTGAGTHSLSLVCAPGRGTCSSFVSRSARGGELVPLLVPGEDLLPPRAASVHGGGEPFRSPFVGVQRGGDLVPPPCAKAHGGGELVPPPYASVYRCREPFSTHCDGVHGGGDQFLPPCAKAQSAGNVSLRLVLPRTRAENLSSRHVLPCTGEGSHPSSMCLRAQESSAYPSALC